MKSVIEILADNGKYEGDVRRITKHQAVLVGLPYPLGKGWKDRCENILLNEEQEKEFRENDMEHRKNKLPVPFTQRNIMSDSAILDKSFYSSKEWRSLRYSALRRSDGRCMCCGRNTAKHGVVLHVDHIVPRSVDPSRALMLENLQVLCEDCNLGKSNTDEITWNNKSKEYEVDLKIRQALLRQALKNIGIELNKISMKKKKATKH